MFWQNECKTSEKKTWKNAKVNNVIKGYNDQTIHNVVEKIPVNQEDVVDLIQKQKANETTIIGFKTVKILIK